MKVKSRIRTQRFKDALLSCLVPFAIFILYFITTSSLDLFFFPPLFTGLLIACIIAGLFWHQLRLRTALAYRGNNLINALWAYPLVFLFFMILLPLLIITLSELLAVQGWLRQILQLSVPVFSRVVYGYFLTMAASATLFFIESMFQWQGHLKRRHYQLRNRILARGVLVFFLIVMLGSLISLGTVKNENLKYLSAMVMQAAGVKPERCITLLEQISKEDTKLYIAAQYRISRLLREYLNQPQKAVDILSEIYQYKDCSYRDNLYFDMIQSKILAGEREFPVQVPSDLNYSCLKEEILYLLAETHFRLKNINTAKALFRELAKSQKWSYLLMPLGESDSYKYYQAAGYGKQRLKDFQEE